MTRTRLAVAVLVVLLALAPFIGLGDRYVLTLLARAMILGMAALGLSLLVGGAGLASLGHAAAMGIGAYVVAALDLHDMREATLVFPAAILAGAAFAGLTGMIASRTSGVYFIMITLAFGQMTFFTISALSALGGDDGYTLYERSTVFGAPWLASPRVFHFVCLGLLSLVWLLCDRVMFSRFGRVLRAAKENPARVQAMGFSPFPFRLAVCTLAGGIGGLSGALLVNAMAFASPAIASWQRSAELLFMVVLGGTSSLFGAVAGSFLFTLAEAGLSAWLDHWRLVFGPLLILAVICLPNGLMGQRRHV